MADSELSSSLVSAGMLQTVVAVFVVTFLTIKLATMVCGRKRYRLPPGPRGVPILGYLPFFGNVPHVTFNEMRETYGDVISISMGSWPAVVISGYDVINEALVTRGDDFSGRPPFTTSVMFNGGRSLGLSTFGPVWKAHRKIVRNVLHTFTNVRNTPFEDIVQTEADTIAEEFLAHGDGRFCPLDNLETAGSSITYQLCYGAHRNIRDDEGFLQVVEEIREITRLAGVGNPLDVMPWVRHFMPWTVRKFKEFIKNLEEAREKKVEERAMTYSVDALRDFTDGFIYAGDNLAAEECALGLNKKRILESLDSVFGAGIDTTATAIQWFVCLMAAFPDVQEKVFQQINEVVGQGRQPNLSDRANLPLIDATICEVLRISFLVPFAVPHATIRDTTLKGYDIPQGTVVMVNLYSICVDEELWGDPANFRPERFLNPEDGTLNRGLVDMTSVFSFGRRRCVGEFVARMELFLVVTRLLQRVRIYKPLGHPDYTLDGPYGIVRKIYPYEICVAPRI